MEAISVARSRCMSTKYGSWTDVMHARSTSVEINSRIVTAVEVLVGGANSLRMDRITLVIMLPHLVSRMRRAWVQNMNTGSKIVGCESTKCLIEFDCDTGAWDALGSPFVTASGSVFCMLVNCYTH